MKTVSTTGMYVEPRKDKPVFCRVTSEGNMDEEEVNEILVHFNSKNSGLPLSISQGKFKKSTIRKVLKLDKELFVDGDLIKKKQ